jgi:uncharacterized coiled-coil protein SlyX
MRHVALSLLTVALLSGCANLTAVRGFAEDTRQISAAFDPLLVRTVEHCRASFLDKRLYTTDQPLARFDAPDALAQATRACQSLEASNAIAQGMSQALADYATQLGALAGADVADRLGDDYTALGAKLGQFGALPPAQTGAVGALLSFVSRGVIVHRQQAAIEEALSHEEAVGALADALVTYAERVYGAYLRQRLADQPLLVEALRGETAAPVASRLQILALHRQTETLAAQQQAIVHLRAAVAQMKATLHDLRTHLDHLSAQERWVEVRKLGREVRSLRQQWVTAF